MMIYLTAFLIEASQKISHHNFKFSYVEIYLHLISYNLIIKLISSVNYKNTEIPKFILYLPLKERLKCKS